MPPQPVPIVTRADVERIVRRDFPASRVPQVLALLREYGKETWHREPSRVQAAVLKLAAGNLEELRRHLEVARYDYRDVLTYAEYPAYLSRVPGPGSVSEEEQQRIIEADWRQYHEWFSR